MVKLRGHHLVCLQFLRPDKLTGPYASIAGRVREVKGRLEGGEEAAIVEGADDVCELCEYLKGGICEFGDEVSEMDRRALALLGLSVGKAVRWSDVKKATPSFFATWREEYCGDCDLKNVCHG